MYTTLTSFLYIQAWVAGSYGLCLLMIFMGDCYLCNTECQLFFLAWAADGSGLHVFANNIHDGSLVRNTIHPSLALQGRTCSKMVVSPVCWHNKYTGFRLMGSPVKRVSRVTSPFCQRQKQIRIMMTQ